MRCVRNLGKTNSSIRFGSCTGVGGSKLLPSVVLKIIGSAEKNRQTILWYQIRKHLHGPGYTCVSAVIRRAIDNNIDDITT